MTDHDAELGALREQYHDLTLIDRRPEGARFVARMPNGTPVTVLALSRGLSSRVQSADRFVETFEHFGAFRHECFPRVVHSGVTGLTQLHVAFARTDAEELVPGAIAASEVAAIGAELARALSIAHGHGLIHGAITTQRMARRREGAQLDSLGLFSALCAAGLTARDAAASLCDAPYVGPEVQMGEPADERSDVFGLGASLYELLTGKAPFGGRTTSFVMATVLADEQPERREVMDPQESGPIVQAVLRAIENDPADRWPSAAAFANALEAGATRASGRSTTASPARGCLPQSAAMMMVAAALAIAIARS